MRGQLGGQQQQQQLEQGEHGAEHDQDAGESTELWSVDTLNRRSEELRLTGSALIPLRAASRTEDLELSEDSLGRSRSRSTTDSQLTIRSGTSGEKVPVCRKCHRTCMATRAGGSNPWAPAAACSTSSTPPPTCPSPSNASSTRPSTASPAPPPAHRKYEPPHLRGDMYYRKEVPRFRDQIKEEAEEDHQLQLQVGRQQDQQDQQDQQGWGPWMLMAGMSMLGGAISGDPFSPAPVPPPRDTSSASSAPPLISVLPPTPGVARTSGMTEEEEDAMWDEMIEAELQNSPMIRRRRLEQMQQLQQQQRRSGAAGSGAGSQDTLDDSSSEVGEPPYRSLSSSCELHRYGTLNSLPDGLAAEEEQLHDQDDHDQDQDAVEEDRASVRYVPL